MNRLNRLHWDSATYVLVISQKSLDTTELNKRNNFIEQRPISLHYVNSTKNHPIFKDFFFKFIYFFSSFSMIPLSSLYVMHSRISYRWRRSLKTGLNCVKNLFTCNFTKNQPIFKIFFLNLSTFVKLFNDPTLVSLRDIFANLVPMT